jgi:hypothetical protein
MGGEAAEASTGEWILAKVERIGWFGVGHHVLRISRA